MVSKKDQLYSWCRIKGVFSSVDVHQWGLDNFYICAKRRVHEFVQRGLKIRRLNDQEIKSMRLTKSGRSKIAWYIFDNGNSQFGLF